jgi:hypothetical protein
MHKDKKRKETPMAQHALLALAVTPHEVARIERPAAPRTGLDVSHLPAPAAQPQRQVLAAHWHHTDDGRLEMGWRPTAPEVAAAA